MDEKQIVILEVEDGSEVETEVMFGFEVAGRNYVSLMTTEIMEDEERDIYLYRFYEDGSIETIDEEAEYEKVQDAFEKIVEGWCKKDEE